MFSQTRLPRLPGVILLFWDQQSVFSATLHVVFLSVKPEQKSHTDQIQSCFHACGVPLPLLFPLLVFFFLIHKPEAHFATKKTGLRGKSQRVKMVGSHIYANLELRLQFFHVGAFIEDIGGRRVNRRVSLSAYLHVRLEDIPPLRNKDVIVTKTRTVAVVCVIYCSTHR